METISLAPSFLISELEKYLPVIFQIQFRRLLEAALMSLNNIETCTVQRSPADAEGGYSWSITFTSNLGNIEMISPDQFTCWCWCKS